MRRALFAGRQGGSKVRPVEGRSCSAALKSEDRRRVQSEGRRSKAERRPKTEPRSASGFGLRTSKLTADSGGGGLTEKWGDKNIRRNPIFLSACSQKELCGLPFSYCPIPSHSDLFSPRSHFVAAGRISGSAQFQVSGFRFQSSSQRVGLGFRTSDFGTRPSFDPRASVFGLPTPPRCVLRGSAV